jgi:prepilin-type N-terminal cleavage/methylation domain-containing protein
MRTHPSPTPSTGRVHTSCQRTTAGFTLMELLVVVTIISILAAMLMPMLQIVRESARTAVCASNIRQQGAAILAFGADQNGTYMPHDVGAYIGHDLLVPGEPFRWFTPGKYLDTVWAQTDASSHLKPLMNAYTEEQKTLTTQAGSRSIFRCPSYRGTGQLTYTLNSSPFANGEPVATALALYPSEPESARGAYLNQLVTTSTYGVYWSASNGGVLGHLNYRLVKLAEINPRRALLWDAWDDKTLVSHAAKQMYLSLLGYPIWHRDQKATAWMLDGRVRRATMSELYGAAMQPTASTL